jgi:O-antigen ligase
MTLIIRKIRNCANWLKKNLPAVLLTLTLVLFVSKSLYNIPVALMALLGARELMLNSSAVFSNRFIRTYILVFMCIWLPMLFSLIDAANVKHSSQTIFPYLRYLFAGIYILCQKNGEKYFRLTITATFLLAIFWSIDATIQFLVGYNLFGFPYQSGQITGMFYPKNTIAHILAAVSPIYFESLRTYGKRNKWLWAFVVPLILVILISGRRAAWVMLVLSMAGYSLYLLKLEKYSGISKKNIFLVILTIFLSVGLVIKSNAPLQKRIIETSGLFSFNYETVDRATARRLPIWETAIRVIQDNWVNGIGPRGFRHVYTQYSPENDIWHISGTTHPHLLLLEILSETGTIGFFGYLCFLCLFYKEFRKNQSASFVFPCALATFVVVFPANSGMAFYGSYWSSLLWWLVLMSFLSMSCENNHRN